MVFYTCKLKPNVFYFILQVSHLVIRAPAILASVTPTTRCHPHPEAKTPTQWPHPPLDQGRSLACLDPQVHLGQLALMA